MRYLLLAPTEGLPVTIPLRKDGGYHGNRAEGGVVIIEECVFSRKSQKRKSTKENSWNDINIVKCSKSRTKRGTEQKQNLLRNKNRVW